MTASADIRAKQALLAGETILVVGRFYGLTRRRLAHLVGLHGGKLAPKAGPRVTTVALAHSAAGKTVLSDGALQLPAGTPASAGLLSEGSLRRLLGLAPQPEAVDRGLDRTEIERLSGLPPRLIACLGWFDVLEPLDGRYAYRDLVAAREAARLLRQGIEPARIVEAACLLGRQGYGFARARLAEGPSGELVRQLAGQLVRMDGQLIMELPRPRTVDDLVEAAEEAEARADYPVAESLYATALRAGPRDPVLAFNLGNVFDAQGRAAEAKIAWQLAVAADPGFAEAWYNLAMSAEEAGEKEQAVALYRRAIGAQPDYADAIYNFALLLTHEQRCAEALELWTRFLELEPDGKQARLARRAAWLCRAQGREPGTQVGHR